EWGPRGLEVRDRLGRRHIGGKELPRPALELCRDGPVRRLVVAVGVRPLSGIVADEAVDVRADASWGQAIAALRRGHEYLELPVVIRRRRVLEIVAPVVEADRRAADPRDFTEVGALAISRSADVVDDVAGELSRKRHVDDGVDVEVGGNRLTGRDPDQLAVAEVAELTLEGAAAGGQEIGVGDVDGEGGTGALRIRAGSVCARI